MRHHHETGNMIFFWLNIAAACLGLVLVLIWHLRKRSMSGGLDLANQAPYPDEKIKGNEKYRTKMALRKADVSNWLTVDKHYLQCHHIRRDFFTTQRNRMVQCLPEARLACAEALQEVSAFLCKRYPAMFDMYASASGPRVRNKVTNEDFPLEGHPAGSESASPLEIAARLAMEDMNVILKDGNGMHYMAATAGCFLIGWSPEDKIGETIAQMHSPVPQWEIDVGLAVNKFMGRLRPDSPMERASYFVQVSYPGEPLPSILFQPAGVGQSNHAPQPEDIIVRRERQLFKRLPRSGGILFTVKTSLTYLPDLPLEELVNLVTEMKSWPENIAEYKGRDHWGGVVVDYCRARQEAAAREP